MISARADDGKNFGLALNPIEDSSKQVRLLHRTVLVSISRFITQHPMQWDLIDVKGPIRRF